MLCLLPYSVLTLVSFKRQLKTHLFRLVFGNLYTPELYFFLCVQNFASCALLTTWLTLSLCLCNFFLVYPPHFGFTWSYTSSYLTQTFLCHLMVVIHWSSMSKQDGSHLCQVSLQPILTQKWTKGPKPDHILCLKLYLWLIMLVFTIFATVTSSDAVN